MSGLGRGMPEAGGRSSKDSTGACEAATPDGLSASGSSDVETAGPGPEVASTGRLSRFTYGERLIHWLVGLSFVYLLLTGLALSHPSLYWITTVVGGGPAARAMHPWVGVIFSAALALMVFVWAKDMGISARDRSWLKAVRHYATRDRDNVPPAGKYNAGQKLFFWAMTALGVAHLVTGILMWVPGGVLGMGPFYGGVVNAMRLLHYVTTVAGGLLLIVHVYLGTIAYPGTLGSMIDGSVSRAWARLHHPTWEKERTGS